MFSFADVRAAQAERQVASTVSGSAASAAAVMARERSDEGSGGAAQTLDGSAAGPAGLPPQRPGQEAAPQAETRVKCTGTVTPEATCGTIRLKLLKIGALITISVRRVRIAMASGCPWTQEWRLAAARLHHARGSPG